MVIFLVIVFLGCSADATESKMCDRVQFSFDDLNGINNNQIFTKQIFEKNGQPVYYSFDQVKNENMQSIMWWSIENNTWLSQTRPHSSNKKKKIEKNFPPKLHFCFSQ